MYLGCQSSSCGFEAEWHPALKSTQVFSAPPPVCTAPHFSHSPVESVVIELSKTEKFFHTLSRFILKSILNNNLCWSLLAFPPAYRSVGTWAFCSSFLSFSFSLQQDRLLCGPVLQRKVTDGFTEVLCFGVSHHGPRVA